MTVSVHDVLTRAKIILQDGDSVRWPLPELALWVLDGAKEIALQQPSATAVTITMDMEVGTRQAVGALYQSMIRAVRNMNGTSSGRSVTSVARSVLDSQSPDWHDTSRVAFKKIVKHVIIDVMDPQSFYVYPGNDGTGEIEIVVSKIPVMSGAPADPDDLDDYVGITVPLIGTYLSALVDYVLARSYTKDSQYAGSEQRAVMHATLFQNGLNAREKANMTANPNTTNAQPRPPK